MTKTREEKIEFIRRCRADFNYFAEKCLKIRDKGELIVPLRPNNTQRYIHKRLEEQKQKTGKVRALILKGRQQGCSTYIGGRYYHQAIMRNNVNVFILSHEWQSTENLFDMVDRYHKHNPLAPKVGTSNAKELRFEKLDSMYRVGTAGHKAQGRSRTSSLFHGSEAALWENAEAHFASSVQTVPVLPGTEVILETTARGAHGKFYEKWQDAERGCDKDGNPVDYIAIFAPWYWEETNVMPPPKGYVLSEEPDDSGVSDAQYAKKYNLSMEQMYFRQYKIQELGSRAMFRQEYPATASEAFLSSADNPFIAPELVTRAQFRHDIQGYGPLILGVDPAGPGGDRFAIAARRGSEVLWTKARNKISTTVGAQWVRSLIDEHKPARVNVDAGGLGLGVIDQLRAMGEKYDDVVYSINFGATSQSKKAKPKKPGPVKRRDEMWDRLRQWLEMEGGVRLPDEDVLVSDLTSCSLKPTLTNDTKLESKDDMRKKGMRSPDLGDAIALTFASLQHIEVDEAPEKKRPEFESGVVETQRSAGLVDSSPNGWMG